MATSQTAQLTKNDLPIAIAEQQLRGKTAVKSAPLADTEYAIQIPAKTSKITFKLRDSDATFKFALGSLSDAGILSGTDWDQMDGGDVYYETGINCGDDQYIYFSSTSASQVGVLHYWYNEMQ
jgi:hypothetical protein